LRLAIYRSILLTRVVFQGRVSSQSFSCLDLELPLSRDYILTHDANTRKRRSCVFLWIFQCGGEVGGSINDNACCCCVLGSGFSISFPCQSTRFFVDHLLALSSPAIFERVGSWKGIRRTRSEIRMFIRDQ